MFNSILCKIYKEKTPDKTSCVFCLILEQIHLYPLLSRALFLRQKDFQITPGQTDNMPRNESKIKILPEIFSLYFLLYFHLYVKIQLSIKGWKYNGKYKGKFSTRMKKIVKIQVCGKNVWFSNISENNRKWPYLHNHFLVQVPFTNVQFWWQLFAKSWILTWIFFV